MFKLRNSHLIAVSAVIALVGSSAPAGVFAAGAPAAAPAVVHTATPVPIAAGTMSLSLDKKTGTVEWEDLRQEFKTGDKCQLEPAAETANLIDFRGHIGSISSSAGFWYGRIGVYEFWKQDGRPVSVLGCNTVNTRQLLGKKAPSESLSLQLGTDAADAFGPLVITRAALSLATYGKEGSIDISLLDADGSIISTSTETWSGHPWTGAVLEPELTGTFSGITLTAKDGAFSVTGGDFDLSTFGDEVFCSEDSDNTFTNDSGVKVTFVGNADGSECSGFGIRLTGTEDAKVWFIKPLDIDPEAQFIFEVPWDTVGWPALTLGSELPQAFIDFEESDPPNEIEMPYCPDYLFDESGTLVGLDEDSSQADRDALALLDMVTDVEGDLRTDGTQFACIGDRTGSVEKSAGSGYDVGLTDLIYLIGDARMSLK